MAKKIVDLFPKHTKGGISVKTGIKAGPGKSDLGSGNNQRKATR